MRKVVLLVALVVTALAVVPSQVAKAQCGCYGGYRPTYSYVPGYVPTYSPVITTYSPVYASPSYGYAAPAYGYAPSYGYGYGYARPGVSVVIGPGYRGFGYGGYGYGGYGYHRYHYGRW